MTVLRAGGSPVSPVELSDDQALAMLPVVDRALSRQRAHVDSVVGELLRRDRIDRIEYART